VGQDAVAMGEVLTTHPDIAKFTFTGSTNVGKKLIAQCASSVKKVSMELGGNAPFIVFDDADIDAAVAGAIASKFRNAGQTCVCTNRILVQKSVLEEFTSKFCAAVNKLTIGNGLKNVNIGPMISSDALGRVNQLVQEAVASGARILVGGQRDNAGANFYQPTVLADVSNDMAVASQEIFGPVAPIISFEDEAQAISLANDTEYGLAAYFYSRDIGRVWRVSRLLDFGMIGINEAIISNVAAPFGGVKESGNGREGSKYGLDDYLEIKYLCLGGLD
ncbi:MAG: aldehyde dehydrogenase family protein, partial [Psychrobium sp.]|nr:aldehyde dehydrogenase family protein [Psychrobium sp.]